MDGMFLIKNKIYESDTTRASQHRKNEEDLRLFLILRACKNEYFVQMSKKKSLNFDQTQVIL